MPVHSLKRRTLIGALPIALGTFLLDPPAGSWAQRPPEGELPEGGPDPTFPQQDPASVREVVAVSHFSLERVRALVDPRPELAKAAWDWGFGDWETALGAASHTGNHAIARYLIENGARPDLFTAAMAGNVAAVRALVEATPGLQALPGPHGITLRKHAELGGDAARPVLEYLDELGGADVGPTDRPLEIPREAFLGTYLFGHAAEDRFEITLNRWQLLSIQRGDGTARTLFHQGEHVFHPAGAPSARIRFVVELGTAVALEVRNPRLVVTARRSAAG